MGEKTNLHRTVADKIECKRQVGTPCCRRQDTMRMDIEEIGWQGVS